MWTCRAPDQGLFLFCCSTLPHLNSWESVEKRFCSLLCGGLFHWFACPWAPSHVPFYLFFLNVIALPRPYYEIRLRVGGTSRFTSRIICHIILQQTKSTNHSSFPPFLMFSMLLFQDLCSLLIFRPVSLQVALNELLIIQPLCTLHCHQSLQLNERQLGRSGQDIFCVISPKWQSRLLRRHFPSDGGADKTFTVSRSLVELAFSVF